MDVYQIVTDRIIAELEQGRIPWNKPWTGTTSGAYSRSTGKPYSLLNQMLLGKPGEWLTFKQCRDAGGRVKKGEKSSIVVFWKQIPVDDKLPDGTTEKKFIPMLRYYSVFHISQCEGITAKHSACPAEHANPDEEAEAIISGYVDREGVVIHRETGDRAYYQPSTDSITVPAMEQFASTAEFYSTMFHEMTHSTGHKDRLNRISSTAHFGNEEYSKEELVAEIGAATLTNHCGLETPESFKNSAAYIQSWLEVLQNDKRMIVSAAGRADKAVNLILTGERPTK